MKNVQQHIKRYLSQHKNPSYFNLIIHLLNKPKQTLKKNSNNKRKK